MRLVNTVSLELEEFFDSYTPPYAILSHTWGSEEISFSEMQDPNEAIRGKSGFQKIVSFCALAKKRGFKYGWADSCCIDKRSSAELSEAINSMYRYYYDAAECLVYLSDVPPKVTGFMNRDSQLAAVQSSRWFGRGWTLQELIAPKERHFFAEDWSLIDLGDDWNWILSNITSIDLRVLDNRDIISEFCVAQRMSWASRRQTTRSEDIAYSLMGLFNVNMPVIYGEGAVKAFRRLQNEIMQTSFDQTIFAWAADRESSGLLASLPADFYYTPPLGLWHPSNLSPFTMTNVGLSIRLNMIEHDEEEGGSRIARCIAALQCDVKIGDAWKILMVHLEPVGSARFVVNGKQCQAYRRIRCNEWFPIEGGELEGWPYKDVLVLQDEHYRLLKRSIEDNRTRWKTKD